jgi:hypothetical protein
MILLRLSPLIPYNALDYISGVTSISLRDYSLALLGLLPGTITFCYIGATASSLAEGTSKASEDKGLRTFAMIFGIFFALAGGFVASYYSRIELDKVSTVLDRISPQSGPINETHEMAFIFIVIPRHKILNQEGDPSGLLSNSSERGTQLVAGNYHDIEPNNREEHHELT